MFKIKFFIFFIQNSAETCFNLRQQFLPVLCLIQKDVLPMRISFYNKNQFYCKKQIPGVFFLLFIEKNIIISPDLIFINVKNTLIKQAFFLSSNLFYFVSFFLQQIHYFFSKVALYQYFSIFDTSTDPAFCF